LLPFLGRFSPEFSFGDDHEVVGETTTVVGRSRIGIARRGARQVADKVIWAALLLQTVSGTVDWGGGVGKRSKRVSLFSLETTLPSSLEMSLFAWVSDRGERTYSGDFGSLQDGSNVLEGMSVVE